MVKYRKPRGVALEQPLRSGIPDWFGRSVIGRGMTISLGHGVASTRKGTCGVNRHLLGMDRIQAIGRIGTLNGMEANWY